MARPRHQPEPFHRRQVEAMAGHGVPEAEIASMIGIDPKTLRKHYRRELDLGHIKANIKVAENLFRKATGDGREGVVAAIFWLKARAGWKETSHTEISGPDGQPFEPVTRIERIILTPMLGSPGWHEEHGAIIDADDEHTRKRSAVRLTAPGRRQHGS